MSTPELSSMKILVIDDEPLNLRILGRILQNAGYTDVRAMGDARAFHEVFNEYKPDLVMTDLMMPQVDGYGVLAMLGGLVPSNAYLPAIVMTGDISLQAKQQALSAGATDFLYKPMDMVETRLRVGNLLRTRALYLELARQNADLEAEVKERSRALIDAHLEMLSRLANAAEFRDDDTGQHTRRVGEIAALTAEVLGLPPHQVELIRHAAPLHDVGKIGVPDRILRKPERLTPEEVTVMRRHVGIGAKILEGSKAPVIREAEEIAQSHHEWWDGSGYPNGAAGDEIPLSGRIVAAADVFDALTHERPYKTPWPPEDAVNEMKRLRAKQFDPEVVDAFVSRFGSDGRAALAV